MKYRSFPLIVCTLLFCVAIFSARAQAQTSSGYTTIDYDEDTGIVDAYSETDEDYEVMGAYGAWVALNVMDQNSSVLGYETDSDDGTVGLASVEIQFTGNADYTYTAHGLHKALAEQWDYDYSYWPHVTTVWYDYANFSHFANEGIQVPVFYAFQGPGPEATRGSQPIILGTTYDEASVATAGLPDHVKVTRDQQGWLCEGGIQVRQINLQIVDSSGKKITTRPWIAESFANVSSNSCQNGAPQPWGCSQADTGATFIDSMSVTPQIHCDSTIPRGSSCGYTLTSTWSVCAGGFQPAVWTYDGETRSDLIHVNGLIHIDNGSELFPIPYPNGP